MSKKAIAKNLTVKVKAADSDGPWQDISSHVSKVERVATVGEIHIATITIQCDPDVLYIDGLGIGDMK